MDGWLYGAGPKTTEFCTKLRTVLKMRGIVPSIVREVGGMLEATGIEDVVHDHRSIPVGWGPAEVAVPSTKNLVAFFESMKPTMLLVLGIPELEYDTLIGEASEELNTYQTYWNIDYAFGRKPLSTE
ncbi:hypothetical protein BC938DRAFT_476432 [Jimgerdemannia flammicorona]|nr:hypothetical protein BC938DRAFT_476432 [Jimgerdemannia flammicorona]